MSARSRSELNSTEATRVLRYATMSKICGLSRGSPIPCSTTRSRTGKLGDDGLHALEREIGRRLQCLERPDACLTLRVASVGRLQIERARQPSDDGRTTRGGHGQSAETTVVHALPTFGRSRPPARSQSRDAPLAAGETGSRDPGVGASDQRPATCATATTRTAGAQRG